MDHFYITLPSNSSESVYGKQPLCSFKTRLAKPIQLNVDEWEVGLAELIYPHTWNNIGDGKFTVRCLENEEWVWRDVEIPPALYESPDQLVNTLNDNMKEKLGTSQRDKIHFMYNSLLRKFVAYVSPGYMVRFPKALAIALGLGHRETTLRNQWETCRVTRSHVEDGRVGRRQRDNG